MKRALYGIAILMLFGLLIAAVWKTFFTCHCTSKADTIVNNLLEFYAAKDQWVTDHPNAKPTTLTWKDLAPYCSDWWKRPVAGEGYRINKIGEPPSAAVRENVDWIPANSELRFSSNKLVQIRSLAPGSPWTTLDVH